MQLKDATVLVVDDEPYYREIMTEWFQSEGSRVLAAEDGVEALQLLDNNTVDVIVTDIRMPRLDGTELVKQVKARGKYTPTAVAITGFSDLSSREAYDLGIEAQLSKPVARKVLISAVQKAVTDREELWARPLKAGNRSKLSATFDSLAAALENKLIAFGHGGFCLKSEAAFPEESPIEFDLIFEADQKALSGQGVVRWSAEKEQELGIEISRVNEQGRSWLAELCRENATVSFIPRTADRGAQGVIGRT
jgi:CheY-like chemotaxis protein